MPAPGLPVEVVHEDDVGQALLLCITAAGPPGAYNVAGDGVLSTADVIRELGLTPVPVPGLLARAPARAVTALPFAPEVLGWAEVVRHPPVMDTTKAKRELGWCPRYTGVEALRTTVRGVRQGTTGVIA